MNSQILLYSVFIFYVQFQYSSQFLLPGPEKLFLVPSVAFRYHSSTLGFTVNAKSTEDWIVYAQGWFFEENPFRSFIAHTALSTTVSDINEERVAYFTASGKKHRELCLEGLSKQLCTETDNKGLISTKFRISNNDIEKYRQPGGVGGKVLFQVSTFNTYQYINETGEIYLCDDNGISFISDIDDTIKVTGVTSARRVLVNTFSGEYKAIENMAKRYRQWEQRYNATFHYLTASPDQLYPFLRDFFEREKFPLGSAHMRHFTWFDKNFINFFMSQSYISQKSKVLKMFLDQTRSRYFVLLGDIFQKDPEIYARIYEQYPQRIAKIFIRKYSDDSDGQKRLEQVFSRIPKEKWQTFENGNDLPENFKIEK
ncbi:unnamed protein product [Didymodactylos carnosus]|uniref:Phosphatidate phosphatase APP1 catalytic domain-containing protein n=1 Tax=Didymodactylos carnosus TaxID=1234261 RepID=A0A814HTE7_9BILA|nr:unnamed protein product [Didymodactylos carnosus]CAF1014347.1 unnamed protein product [Didymodactylos carnosus]CAF3602256.1 unnamed protein product [Didymodactylos carnosus]CAF3785952.1 unnamed protein product [Didymodactylos carnosus]